MRWRWLGVFIVWAASASLGLPLAEDKAPRPKEQKFCPIMTTDEVTAKDSHAVTYRGVTILLCCDQCVNKFRRDPAAYLDPQIIPALDGMPLPPRGIEQEFCPVYKVRKVSSRDPYVIYKGVKIYVYNDIAKLRFEKDPERYADPKLLPQLRGLLPPSTPGK